MPKEITAFQCDYCNKFYKHKASATRHEKKCFSNPLTQSCLTCSNMASELSTVYIRPTGGNNYGDDDYEVKNTFCTINNKELVGHSSKPSDENMIFQNNCSFYNKNQGA